MENADLESYEKTLKKMLSLALKLAENNDPYVYELGHYLADNILSKVCMVVAKREGRDDLIFINGKSGRTFDFPNLFKNILEVFFTDIPNYDVLVKDLHADRSMYQHKFESLTYTIRQPEAEKYVNFVKNMMESVGIIQKNEEIHPTKSLVEILLTETEKAEKFDYSIFQKIYGRLGSKNASNITIDIKSMIEKVGFKEFAKILRMNNISDENYKLMNDKWFILIHSKFHNALIIKDLQGKLDYSYLNSEKNAEVLEDFLQYFRDCCKDQGIEIENSNEL